MITIICSGYIDYYFYADIIQGWFSKDWFGINDIKQQIARSLSSYLPKWAKCDNHEEIKTFSSLLVAQTSVGLLLMLITSLDLLSKASLFQMSTNVFFCVNNASYSQFPCAYPYIASFPPEFLEKHYVGSYHVSLRRSKGTKLTNFLQ